MIQFSELAQTAEKLYNKLTGLPIVRDEREMLISDLRAVNERISQAEAMLNELTDSDLIDYANYDILAERARYSHIIKECKKRNLHF